MMLLDNRTLRTPSEDVIFNDLQQIIQLDPALKDLHPAEVASTSLG